MSDSFTTYLSLDLGEEDAPEAAARAAAVLADQGFQPAEGMGERTFELQTGWHNVSAIAATDDAHCPHCGEACAQWPELMGEWDASRREPTLTCDSCHGEARLGDWFGPEGHSGCFFCHASVTLWNARTTDTAALRAALGGRFREVRGLV